MFFFHKTLNLVVQGATFSKHGFLFTLNGYCQIPTLFESSEERWNCPDRAEKPEGLTYWDLDEATNKHEEARGQLHAILRCANKGIDDVFFKHYGLRVAF